MTSRETVTHNDHWFPIHTIVMSKYLHLVEIFALLLYHYQEIKCSSSIIFSVFTNIIDVIQYISLPVIHGLKYKGWNNKCNPL